MKNETTVLASARLFCMGAEGTDPPEPVASMDPTEVTLTRDGFNGKEVFASFSGAQGPSGEGRGWCALDDFQFEILEKDANP